MDSETLAGLLWSTANDGEAPRVLGLLDGARDETIVPAIWESGLRFQCLYSGSLSRSLQLAAPYLVQLAPDSRFFRMLVAEGWGRAWCSFVVARVDVTFKTLRDHFRTLLRVRDKHNQILVFRFYDPRVLRLYMRTCEPLETAQMLGPTQALACESGDGDALIEFKSASIEFNRHVVHASQRTMARGSNRRMVVIRKEQFEALAVPFRECLLAFVRTSLPSYYAASGEEGAAELVKVAIESAAPYGIESCRDVGRYIAFMDGLGWSFDSDPSYSWARAILLDDSLASEDKLTRLLAAVMAR
jgi:hypothetical protein